MTELAEYQSSKAGVPNILTEKSVEKIINKRFDKIEKSIDELISNKFKENNKAVAEIGEKNKRDNYNQH